MYYNRITPVIHNKNPLIVYILYSSISCITNVLQNVSQLKYIYGPSSLNKQVFFIEINYIF